MSFNLNSLTLMGKLQRDPHFGRDSEFRGMYNNNDHRNDSALSSDSAGSDVPNQGDKVIVDLDLIVEKWIAFMWDKTKTKNTKYEFDDLQVVVNWKRVQIEQEDVAYEKNSPHRKIPSNQTLFKTYFTNRTDQEQEYSFKTERITRQSVGFSFMKGFSHEKEGSISFKLPQDIIEIGGGLRTNQSVECGKDSTNEQEVVWAVDSMIKVKPHSKTCASLVINEIEFDRNFQVETRIKGRLIVTLTDRSSGQFVKTFSGDITDIIRKAIESYWLPNSGTHVFEIIEKPSEKYARSVLKGKCKFRLGIEQYVNLNEENI